MVRSFVRTMTSSVSQWSPEGSVPESIRKLLPNIKSNVGPQSALVFIQIVSLLKSQRRTGWVDRGLPSSQVESISDHMYRMGVILMLLPREKVDVDRCVKISLVHDIAESLVGDIPPYSGVTKEEKHRRERVTIEYLADLIHEYNPKFANEMAELWWDYESIRTPEARYVKDIDKFEMIQQAWEYEQAHGLKYDLSEFYNSRLGIVSPEIGELCDEVIRQRTAFIEAHK